MNFVSFFLWSLFAMSAPTFSIPHIERKSWIRHTLVKRSPACPDCVSLAEETTCLMERRERRRIAQLTLSKEYIPECRKDGSYNPVQCHPSTRSCWCVNHTGRPIPGTSVFRPARPTCAEFLRRPKSAMKRSSQGKSRKSCSPADRTRFNAALLKNFRSEFNRITRSNPAYSGLDGKKDEVVLSWKFDHLDRNRDGLLSKNETNNLKRVVKQQVSPRQCAKNFVSYCAMDDRKISKNEWLECLHVTAIENLPFDTFNSLVDSGSSRGMAPFHKLLRPAETPLSAAGSQLSLLTNSKGTEVAEASNCRTDRQSALESQKLGHNVSTLVPQCTSTGNYERIQCSQGNTFCWCVDEETGVQIPNTVVENSQPRCDKNSAKAMKGCTGSKKDKFIKELMDSLSKAVEISSSWSGRYQSGSGSRNVTAEEQVGKWHFNRLDTNGNGLMERKEWKVFRNETAADKRLKKCGKKLPRYCDANQDMKITLAEWLDCLGIKSAPRKPAHSKNSNGPRVGKNPFTNILKQRR